MPLILGRSGTQYVSMVTKLLSSYCAAPLVEPYCKESNISVSNWPRYLFSKERFQKSKKHFSSHTNYLFML